MTPEELYVGKYVHYQPEYGSAENGRVKSIREKDGAVFVVYKCNNDWDHFQEYTGQNTPIEDLYSGWVKV